MKINKQLISLVILSCFSLVGCNKKEESLYQFNQQYIKSINNIKDKEYLLNQYTPDEIFVLLSAINKINMESTYKVSSSSKINDAQQTASEDMKNIMVNEVFNNFNNENKNSPIIKDSVDFNDIYLRDIGITNQFNIFDEKDKDKLAICLAKYNMKSLNSNKIKSINDELFNKKVRYFLENCN